MKGFKRNNQLLSLCGLNCGLCPMHIDGYCPGCGGGAGNQSCRIARCSLEHDLGIQGRVFLPHGGRLCLLLPARHRGAL